jgi:hypothetical protein
VARGNTSTGACSYCGKETAKGSMARHLAACAKRRALIEQPAHEDGAREVLYHLRVQDSGRGEYWLDVEMRGSATLKDLDYYLRGIWLDCCGHLSQFSTKGWRGEEVAMSRRIGQVFTPGRELTHIYDFGTSSETLVKVMATREGRPVTARAVALMARNTMPKTQCMECERPAVWLCMECLIEDNEPGTLCDEHAKTHPHEDYGEPIRLVNSPRLGMCGYEGPAEPPY